MGLNKVYKSVARFGAAVALATFSSLTFGQGLADQWYIGLGGGISILDPEPVLSPLQVDDDNDQAGTLFIGRDLDSNLSAQLQLSSYGDAEINNNSTVSFIGADVSMLYRIVDSRVLLRSSGNFGASLYGRIGLGFVDRDTALELRRDSPAGVSGGAGVEVYLSRNFALRAEAVLNASDVTSATLSVVGRFGGPTGLRELPPAASGNQGIAPVEPEAPLEPESPVAPIAPVAPPVTPDIPVAPDVPVVPDARDSSDSSLAEDSAERTIPDTSDPIAETPAPAPQDQRQTQLTPDENTELNTSVAAVPAGVPSDEDRDGDGVLNADDVCLRSPIGFPVRANGCPLFDGVLSGVVFEDLSAELLPVSFEQLDFLVDVLKRFPQSRIELHAHTDNRGTVREQSIITRARLRTVGTYLVQNGIRANRLVLRSFGGTRPLYQSTPEGRVSNNRIEVLEKTE